MTEKAGEVRETRSKKKLPGRIQDYMMEGGNTSHVRDEVVVETEDNQAPNTSVPVGDTAPHTAAPNLMPGFPTDTCSCRVCSRVKPSSSKLRKCKRKIRNS